MKQKVKEVRMSDDSIEQLRSRKGAVLKRIGFVADKEFSPVSILDFDGAIIKIVNQPCNIGGETFAQLSFQEASVDDDIAYVFEGDVYKFEYDDIGEILTDVKLVRDTICWQDQQTNSRFKMAMQCAVILILEKRQVLVFARDTVAEAVEIYDSTDILDSRLSIEEAWPVLDADDRQRPDVDYCRKIESV